MNKLIYAVKIVSLGGYYISTSITERALEAFFYMRQFPGGISEKVSRVRKRLNNFCSRKYYLSPTERCIIEGVAKGFSDNEIAEHFNLCPDTIRNYISAIKHKIHFKNRVQIAIYSLLLGLIDLDQLGLENFEEFLDMNLK